MISCRVRKIKGGKNRIKMPFSNKIVHSILAFLSDKYMYNIKKQNVNIYTVIQNIKHFCKIIYIMLHLNHKKKFQINILRKIQKCLPAFT